MSHPALSSRSLLKTAHAPATVKKYDQAVKKFLTWCQHQDMVFADFEELDEFLTDYLQILFETNDGKGKGQAAETIFGIVRLLPRCKPHLLMSQMALRSWLKQCPSQSYPPLTWDLTAIIAVQMVRHGRFRLAVATLLAFDCLLRVGELVALTKDDIVDAASGRTSSVYQGVVLRLKRTKTGLNKSVELDRPAVIELLRIVLHFTKPGGRLFPVSADVFRRFFKRTCMELGLSSKYVPHSLRHGGATHLYLMKKPMQDIMQRGRWAASKSASRYIQTGPALLATVDIPPAIAVAAGTIGQNIVSSIFHSLSQLH